MKQHKKMNKLANRIMAGLLCTVLLLADVTPSVAVVLAQEALDGQAAAQQEMTDAETDAAETRESVDTNEEENAQTPDEENDGADVQNPDEEDNGEETDVPDEDADEEDSESGEEKGDVTEEIPSEEDAENVEAENETEGPSKSVLADSDDIIEEGTYGNITWKVDSNRKLTVEGTGDFGSTTTHSASRVPWLKNWNTYYYLTSAEINVTGMTDASYMFYGCSKLTSVSFVGSDTGSVTNMSNMFNGCVNLTSIEWGENFDTGNVTDMSNMFYGCDVLTGDDLGDFDTGSVTNMSWMFTYCDNMGELDLSGWDTSQVTDMSYMFGDCGFSKITLGGKFTTQNVKNMTFMFYCHSDPDKLGYEDYLGDARLNLTGMDLSQLDLSSVEDMSYIFGGCNLKQMDFAKLGTDKTTTLKGLFAGCDLTGIDFSNLRTDTITDMSNFFDNSIGTIDFASLNTEHVTNMSSFLSGGMGGIGGFRENAYWRESIDLSGLNTENVTDMSNMFRYQGELTNLNLSGLDTRNVTNMSGMFYSCHGLTGIDMSGFNTDEVTDMSNLFSGCSGLTEIDLSYLNTGNVTDMAGMFSGCTGLAEIDLSGLDTGKVANMASMFYMCSNLKNIKMGNLGGAELKMINGYSPLYMMFFSCSSLESIDLSRFNLENLSSIDSSLSVCTKLTSIYTPYNVKVDEKLPVEKDSDVWYRANGEQVTTLPKNLSYSVLITRNRIPDVTEPHLEVTKRQTAYLCGEPLLVDDLTVVYYDSEGSVRTITEGFTTNSTDIDMSTPGLKKLTVTYTDSDKGITLTADITITVTIGLTDKNTTITLSEGSWVYNGYAQRPVPTVKVNTSEAAQESEAEIMLVEGTDYTVSYQNNTDAGEAAVIITGMDVYSGAVSKEFTIGKALLTIKVKDMNIAIGEDVPETFVFDAEGLADVDRNKENLISLSYIFKNPEGSIIERLTIDTSKSTSETGIYYYIIPTDVNAGTNYEVNKGVNEEDIRGILTIMEERVMYNVTFNMMGHGTNIAPITGIKAGSLIDKPVSLTEGDIVTEEVSLGESEDVKETHSYIFNGWYKDTTFAAKQKWNFDTDTVQSDTKLYACWLEKGSAEDTGLQFSLQEIQDQIYTGSAIKPTVYVYTADGKTLLKPGKDYTIKYGNNIEADTEAERTQGGIGHNIDDDSKSFNKNLAYVIITGKGNYSETIYKNFHILPAEIATEDGNAAAGVTLKYSDQLVANTKKEQNPFSSLKYKKTMKLGQDFMITLKAGDDVKYDTGVGEDEDWSENGNSAATTKSADGKKYIAPTIPKGYSGTFTMTVVGTGNYTGTITKSVVVADKNYLIKNVGITLGKNQKSKTYENGGAVFLTPGVYDADSKKYYRIDEYGNTGKEEDVKDIFTVKAGKTYLVHGIDYEVSYSNNKAVGTATMTITGMGHYMGTKSVTFKIVGTAFNAKNVTVVDEKIGASEGETALAASMPYTGRAVTQNKVTLKPSETAVRNGTSPKPLTYGTHYTISYKNNIKKGTATMTFTAKPESGYTGSIKKTFKIAAQSLLDADFVETGMTKEEPDRQKNTRQIRWSDNNPAIYSKNGATLSFTLKNADGIEMKQGTDYTASYKNNKDATVGKTTANPPTLTIKGKGNYAGTLTVTFGIQQADIGTALEDGSITVSASSVAKKDNMQFKDFKFKVLDGKKALSVGDGKDYTLDETNCTPEIIKAYAEALEQKKAGTTITAQEPKVRITGVGNYTGSKEISLVDYIYVTKLTSSNLYVIVSNNPAETTYTGTQVAPGVTVYYGSDAAKVKEAKKAEAEEVKKNPEKYGLTELKRKPDTEDGTLTVTGNYYTAAYGVNNTAGKNKGSVTITGAGMYGGSVTVKFEILKRKIYN